MSFFNKILGLFKKKKFAKLFTVIVSCSVIVIYGATTILGSYIPWKSYFDNAIAQRDYEKYLQTLPFKYLGVSVKLADGVDYYADGRAYPVASDFEVTAHFTEKGKDFDRILDTSEYTFTVPENFEEEGGVITVSYSYQPEDTVDEEGNPITPDPIVKSATMDIDLTPVQLTKLVLTGDPYRVHYSDAMSFDPEGIKLNATYNNGDVIEIGAEDVKVETEGKLTTSTEEVMISYELGGTKISCGVPVTVQSAATFDEGDIIGLEVEGDVYVEQGESTSSAEPVIRATYDTGNKLLISSNDYFVTGNTPTATFENNCILTVALNSNAAISCRTAAAVISNFESEDSSCTTIVGGTAGVVTDETTGKQLRSTKLFRANNTISFAITGNDVSKGKLNLRVANVSNSAINLAKVMSLTINGRYVPIDATINLPANADISKYPFQTVTVATPVLKTGANQVVITFNAKADIAFDKAEYITKYDGVFYASMDEYVTQCLTNGYTPDFEVTMVTDWESARVNGGPYMHGMCTDGTYFYAARTSYAEPGVGRGVIVTKHDVNTGAIIATSVKSLAGSNEACASVAYSEGKIIIFFADGTEWYIGTDLAGEWKEYDGFAFEDIETTALKDVYYNSAIQKYAVYSGNTVFIFNKEMKLENKFTPSSDARVRMSGSVDYIYVCTSHDGQYMPKVQIFNWLGEKVAVADIPNNQEVMNTGVNFNINLAKTNVQGIVTMNDSWYFTVLAFNQGQSGFSDSAAVIKVDYPRIKDRLDIVYSTGEYFESTTAAGDTPTAVAGDNTQVPDTSGWAMSGVSDGKFMYFTSNTGGNGATTVYKYNPLTGEVVETSQQLSHGGSGDNSKAFIYDGKICYIAAGKVFSIKLDRFDKNCIFEQDNTIPQVSAFGTPFAAAWNDNAGRFAVISGGKLHIVAENNAVIARDITISHTGASAKDVASDDMYIYVVYTSNGLSNTPVDIFTWDGTKVGTLIVENYLAHFNCKKPDGTGSGNFNVQGIFIHNNRLYTIVCVFNSEGSAKSVVNLTPVVYDDSQL